MKNVIYKVRLMLLGIFIALGVNAVAQIGGGAGISGRPWDQTPDFDTLDVAGATVLDSTLTVIGTSDLQGNVSDSLGDFTIADAVAVTGTATFTNTVALEVESTTPRIRFNQTNATATNGHWNFLFNDENFKFQTTNDSWAAPVDILSVERTGTTVDSINLSATALQHNGNDLSVTQGSFTATTTGCTTATSDPAKWTRYGDVVTIAFPNASCTSNATTTTITGLPTALQIPSDAGGFYDARPNTTGLDNSVQYLGVCVIFEANSTINCYPGVNGAAWTASGNKSVNGFMVTYLVR